MTVQASLLDAPAGLPIVDSIAWLNGLVGGTLAVSLAVIGFALLGFLLLSGRLPTRRAGRVVIGAFLLFGAPAIAAGLILGGSEVSAPPPPPPVPVATEAPRADLPPANYDPYAGASLRRD